MNDIATINPMSMIAAAVANGTPISELGQLFDLQQRWEASEARKAYVSAMSAFRAGVPTILKARKTNNSKYAGLAESISTIRPALTANGLSHSWSTSQADGKISVTCCVTHIMGHSECTTLEAAPDTGPGRNNIQAVGSTVSYLERYTLYAILGLASTDQDDDGNAGTQPRITDDQALTIEAAIKDNGIDMDQFLAWLLKSMKADCIANINAKAFDTVMAFIRSSVKARAKKAGKP
jgi:hypothetical protein